MAISGTSLIFSDVIEVVHRRLRIVTNTGRNRKHPSAGTPQKSKNHRLTAVVRNVSRRISGKTATGPLAASIYSGVSLMNRDPILVFSGNSESQVRFRLGQRPRRRGGTADVLPPAENG
jgi:hypothetical protein